MDELHRPERLRETEPSTMSSAALAVEAAQVSIIPVSEIPSEVSADRLTLGGGDDPVSDHLALEWVRTR